MKLQTTLRSTMVMAALVLLSFMSFTFSSCTKTTTTNNDGAKFVGTWVGTSTCVSGTTNFVISAGSSGNTVTISGSAGSGSCYKAITYTMTANGNNLSGNQTFTDLCGNSYTMVIAGSLSGNNLTLTETVSGSVSASCVFTGSK